MTGSILDVKRPISAPLRSWPTRASMLVFAGVMLCAVHTARAEDTALPPIPSPTEQTDPEIAAPPIPQAAPQTGVKPSPWNGAVEIKKSPPTSPPGSKTGTTVIEREGSGASAVRLVALLTNDGQQIDQGIVWRIYRAEDPASKLKLVAESREPSPSVKLPPGDYTVNAGFGRAHLTRRITIAENQAATERFVINAGGLRVAAVLAGAPVAPGTTTYAIFSDDRDQSKNRTAVMSNAKPGPIIRLNAGIYRIVSTYGDANAHVETDVTVEAGKLTEATVTHAAGKAMFKLVTRAGGEALTDAVWTITNAAGEIVKETPGALPSHYLAPGEYSVAARSGGQVYRSKFTVTDGGTSVVEVLIAQSGTGDPPSAMATSAPAPGAAPDATPAADDALPGVSLEFKNP